MAGSNSATKMPMIAMTTSNSTSVKAALGVLASESRVVLIAAHELRAADVFAGGDADRLALAMDRIERAREVLA